MKKIYGILMVLMPFFTSAQSISPYVFLSAANTVKSGDISMNYVIGDAIISTLRSTNNQTLVQGFQVGTKIFVNGIEIKPGNMFTSSSGIIIFPNPTLGILNITNQNLPDKKILIDVVDLSGNTVILPFYLNNSLNSVLDISGFARGVYYIRVKSTDHQVNETFKVVKID